MREFPYPKKISDENRKKAVNLTDQTTALHEKLKSLKTPHQQESVKRQIESVNRQIDELVYELYGLSKEEVALVENSQANK